MHYGPAEIRFFEAIEKTDSCWLWKRCVDSSGYGLISAFGNTRAKAHRVSYMIHYGPIPNGFQVDHKCMNTRCVNPTHLRLAAPSQNTCYSRVRRDSRSGLRGVCKCKYGWRSQITHRQQKIHIGYFKTKEEAYLAYCYMAKHLFGEFALMEPIK